MAVDTWQVVDDRVYVRGDNPFDNPFFGYRTTELILPDGRGATYHGLIVGDMVHVLPLEQDLTVHLVRQPRPNARPPEDGEDVPWVLELPGGGAHPGLSLPAAADQELCEETGRRARRMERLGILYTAVGVSDEIDNVFLATELYAADTCEHDEATEQSIRVVSAPFGEFYDELRSGRHPVCAQTLSAFSIASALL